MVAELEKQRRHLDGAGEEKIFNGREEFGKSSNTFKQIVALAIWLGAIHFNAAVALFTLLFLPLSKALLFVFTLLLLSVFCLFLSPDLWFLRISGFFVCSSYLWCFPYMRKATSAESCLGILFFFGISL